MQPNFNKASNSGRSRTPATSERLQVVTSTDAPASRMTPAVVSSAGTSRDSDVPIMPPPPNPTIPNFNQAFNLIQTRRTLGRVVLPPALGSERMFATSAAQASWDSWVSPAVAPVAGTSRASDIDRMQRSSSYDADHINQRPRQHSRDPRVARRQRNPSLEDPQMLEDSQNEALDLTRHQRDRTAQEMSRLPRPPRPWSQPPPLKLTTSSHHRQEIQRHNSLPTKFKMAPQTRTALKKVPDDEIDDYWNDIMEYIKRDLENMGLNENDLEPHKPEWCQGEK